MAILKRIYVTPATPENATKSGNSWLITHSGLHGIMGRDIDRSLTDRVMSRTPGEMFRVRKYRISVVKKPKN